MEPPIDQLLQNAIAGGLSSRLDAITSPGPKGAVIVPEAGDGVATMVPVMMMPMMIVMHLSDVSGIRNRRRKRPHRCGLRNPAKGQGH